MERAIREVKGSLLVAIPREIAERYGWRAGDKVTFEDQGKAVLLKTPETARVVYTVGYEGKASTEFIRTLKQTRIEQVLDVREKPVSRKPGFSKSALDKSLKNAGMSYIHLGELGSPTPVRHEYQRQGDFDKFAKKYETHLAGQAQQLTVLAALAETKRSVVMCFEHDWNACHRSILSRILEKKGFKCVHI